jgi:hypothetical protein
MISKPLSLVLLVSISFNLLFGYLSYEFYGDKKKAEISLDVAVKTNKELSDSLGKKETSCKIDEAVSTEFQVENKAKEKEKDETIKQIDKLSSADKIVAPKATTENTNAEISLDSRLPADLAGLLQRHCDSTKGSACDNP